MGNTYKEKIHYLMGYRHYTATINYLRKEIEACKNIYGEKVDISAKISGMPGAHNNNSTVEQIAIDICGGRVAERIGKLERELHKNIRKRSDIVKNIISLADEQERYVLELMYMSGYKFGLIAEKLDMPVTDVYKLHRRAVSNLRLEGHDNEEQS